MSQRERYQSTFKQYLDTHKTYKTYNFLWDFMPKYDNLVLCSFRVATQNVQCFNFATRKRQQKSPLGVIPNDAQNRSDYSK